MKNRIVKFSDLGITFKTKNELIKLSLIVAAGILGIGIMLYSMDTFVSAVVNLFIS